MKFKFALLLILGLSLQARAAVFTYSSGTINATIPDGSLTGWSSVLHVSAQPTELTGLTVTLNLQGGYNGDLYAYLSYGDVLLPLLNRVGVGTGNEWGFSTSGMNVTFSDAGALNIHDVASPANSGVYQPDGRAISPLSDPSAFDAGNFSQPGDLVSFSDFYGMNPNGAWTLFVADVSSGEESQLESWGMEITAVPEPVNVAMSIFGGLLGVGAIWRRMRNARQRKTDAGTA